MTTLSTLIGKKAALFAGNEPTNETDLEQGSVYIFSTSDRGTSTCGFCWKPPANGTAVIEIWGAAGSGSNMCCCGIGLPGNPGAYAKKTVSVTTTDWICITPGCSTGGQVLCFRGCAGPTTAIICLSSGCSCLCAEGGMSGFAICSSTSGSPLNCFAACNFCTTAISGGCGIVCNIGSTFTWLPSAFGGDINCGGGFSCLYIGNCDTSIWCCFSANVRIPAGIISSTQQDICVPFADATASPMGGAGTDPYFAALAGVTRSPTNGGVYRRCWASGQYCGCYESQSCIYTLPAAIPGLGPTVCSSVRDGGQRGGSGKIKIRFVSS